MAQMDIQESQGNSRITVTQFKKRWRSKLQDYKNYITDTMQQKAEEAYMRYQACKNPQEVFRIRAGLSRAQFGQWYVSSMLGLEENMEWQNSVVGGGTMAVTGTPGIAKTAIIMSVCEELGIACVHYTLAGLMAADIKGLPYIVKNQNGVTTGVDYEQGTKLPVSVLSSKMSGMSNDVFNAKKDLGTPSEMRYLPSGLFGYKRGIAPEFGVLLLDEFLNLDQRGQATLQKIISQSEKGYRGLAEGSYTLPPYWLVICAMNSSSEGGMSRGDDEDDVSEFIRQRISADGFYTLYADEGTREWIRTQPEFGDLIPNFLDWADAQRFKAKVVSSSIPGEDMGFLQYPGENGKISSVRLWLQAARQANNLKRIKAAEEWDGKQDKDIMQKLEEERQQRLAANVDDDISDDDMLDFLREGNQEDWNVTSISDKEVADFEAKLDLTNSIIAARTNELSKVGKELSPQEWELILNSVFGIGEIATQFSAFYKVHAGVYNHFKKIEPEFIAYLVGKNKKAPALGTLDELKSDMIALLMSCKGYLMSACQRSFDELYADLKAKLENPISTPDELDDITQIVVNMHTIPLRASRWLNDPTKFPIGVNDKIIALCRNVNEMQLQGANISTGGSSTNKGLFKACVNYLTFPLFQNRTAEIMALGKKSPRAMGAQRLLLTQARDFMGFIYLSKANNWMPKSVTPPIKLDCGKDWPYELEDKKDEAYLDMLLANGSAEGDNIADMFAK